MAIFDRPGADTIYAVARDFRTHCLLADGSLLFEGHSVWKLDLLLKLQALFVDNPDLSDKSFLEKLHGQIGRAGKDAIRLAGELMCVYFLFPAKVGGPRKREVIRTILRWADQEVPDNNAVFQAFDYGIGGAWPKLQYASPVRAGISDQINERMEATA